MGNWPPVKSFEAECPIFRNGRRLQFKIQFFWDVLSSRTSSPRRLDCFTLLRNVDKYLSVYMA